MVELLGSGYIVDYCFSILLREAKEKRDNASLQYYVTDCLRLLTENTAKSAHTEAGYIGNRYADIVNPVVQQELSGDEIAADIIKRAGLSFKGEEVKEDGSI